VVAGGGAGGGGVSPGGSGVPWVPRALQGREAGMGDAASGSVEGGRGGC